MEFPGLGMRARYETGTLTCFSGRLLQHGVSGWTGDRVCYAYYMKDDVHERAGIKAAGWAEAE